MVPDTTYHINTMRSTKKLDTMKVEESKKNYETAKILQGMSARNQVINNICGKFYLEIHLTVVV